MNAFLKISLFPICLTLPFQVAAEASTPPLPAVIAAPGEQIIATFHAEGAQVYQCKADADGRLVWQAREPIATLLHNGETVGRHYAGPSWEHLDGSTVGAKVSAKAPGMSERYSLAPARSHPSARRWRVLRGHHGPAHQPRAEWHWGHVSADTYQSVPYSADYVFLGNGM